MIAVEIQLLTGRYHATPWGRHVNEGDVEWPPSPWRLLRALLATGFAKLGWTEVPETARVLINALAEHPPTIALPPGAGAHTRHFMPPFKGNKDKVLDAFVDVGRDGVVGVEWEAELSAPARDLLDCLLGRLSYLGRAEAWVEARRVGSLRDGILRCVSKLTSPGPGYERVQLLAPVAESEYREWREANIRKGLEDELAKKDAAARAKGKKAPAKLSAKDSKRVEAMYPPTLVQALLARTGSLQEEGWSQPPGSKWLPYWRHEGVLSPPPRVATSASALLSQPDTAVLAISSDTRNGERLPRLTDALPRLASLRDALAHYSEEVSPERVASPCLIARGSDGARIDGHLHAVLVPLCLEASAGGAASAARMDHVLVHARMGFDDAAQAALRRVRAVFGRDGRYFVSLVGLGTRCDLANMVHLLGEARAWISMTPFVAPRHLKRRGKNTLVGQVLAELESRSLPHPERIELELVDRQWCDLLSDSECPARAATHWRHFRRAQPEHYRHPPSQRGFGLRLVFPQVVAGPIALGYASHIGLGTFAPTKAEDVVGTS